MEKRSEEFCYEIRDDKIHFYSRGIKGEVYSDKGPLQFIGSAKINSPKRDADTIRSELEDWLKLEPMRYKCSQETNYTAHQLVQNNIPIIGKSVYISMSNESS